MKKLYTIILWVSFFLCCSIAETRSQGIYQFWGITDFGGINDQGTLFSTRSDGSGHKMRNVFNVLNPGSIPKNHRPVVYNNKMYGVMPNGNGTTMIMDYLYEYDPATNKLTRKVDLAEILNIASSQNVGDASYTLALYNNKLYGVSYSGGANGVGCLFEYNPANNTVTVKYSFVQASGSHPSGALAVYNNKFYGITFSGGAYTNGVLYEFNPSTNTYSKKADFNEAVTGSRTRCGLTVYNGMLYGITSYGTGANYAGALFRFNPANSTFAKLVNMNTIGGDNYSGNMVVYNSKLYGVTDMGGAENDGVLFEFDPATTTLTKKLDLTEAGGFGSSSMEVFNNKLYGSTGYGGPNGDGNIFEYNPATNTRSVKVTFSGTYGRSGAGFMTLYNNRFYGFTRYGGTAEIGVLFEYNPGPNGYTKKIDMNTSPTGFRPSGHLNYYQGKLYGTSARGGAHNFGVIYAFNIATQTYEVLYNMEATTGYNNDQGGMVLHNNKFYGVTANGGALTDGVLFEFDPATNAYTVKVNFASGTGRRPFSRLSIVGSKLYGTHSSGGPANKGSIFEYDLLTNAYTAKYTFPPEYGNPLGSLTLYGGKLWGTTTKGGLENRGIIFSWNISNNTFVKEFDLLEEHGVQPEGGLVVYDNQLWGLISGQSDEIANTDGHLFSFNPATHSMTIHHNFDDVTTGAWPRSTLTIYREKIYGLCTGGGDLRFGGTLFEYNPATATVTKKVDFTGANGRLPRHMQLTTVPAPVAPGYAGACWNASEVVSVNNTNNSEWIPFTDSEGRAIAEINANGNNLGNVNVRFYTHNGATRKDPQGRFYLDRNINITVTNQPSSPVGVRLYIRKTELDKLINTPGAGVNGLTSLAIFKNDDGCTNAVKDDALPIPATAASWENDYVLTTTVDSFSSFYFGSSNYSALPITLESFEGAVKPQGNVLTWKASCTDPVVFTIERSTDGVHFSSIGTVEATQQDCHFPFQFTDPDLSSGSFYYRLKMEEQGAPANWSKIVVLNRGHSGQLQLTVAPNPVVGSTATIRTISSALATLQLVVHDMSGRKVLQQTISVPAGAGIATLPVGTLGSGTYILHYQQGDKRMATKFVKQ